MPKKNNSKNSKYNKYNKYNNQSYNNNKSYKKKSNGCLLNIAIVIAFIIAINLTIKTYFPLKDYDIISSYADANGLKRETVCAIINVESGFNPNAVSNKGASGYMQLMEQTANWGIETLGIEDKTYDDIFEPELNIAIGTWYFSNLCRQFGSENLAIISYNAGSGNVTKWLKTYNFNEEETLKNIPFKETKNYYFKIKINEFVYKYLLKFYYK